MLVHQILKSKGSEGVLTVKPGTLVSEAAGILAEKGIGTVVVVGGVRIGEVEEEEEGSRRVERIERLAHSRQGARCGIHEPVVLVVAVEAPGKPGRSVHPVEGPEAHHPVGPVARPAQPLREQRQVGAYLLVVVEDSIYGICFMNRCL